jgi:hypothetical protein
MTKHYSTFRCYHVNYRGMKILIPSCWGATMGGITEDEER